MYHVTVEPLYKDTPEVRTPPLNQGNNTHGSSFIEKHKLTPEMRTPPLIRAPTMACMVSAIYTEKYKLPLK